MRILPKRCFFPEVSRYGDSPETLKRAIVKNCVQLLEAESPALFFSRTLPPSIETTDLTLHLEPPARRLPWRKAIDLRLDVVRWRHLEHAHVAFIPALGIEVVSNKVIQKTIEEVIQAEDKKCPYSDQQLVKVLAKRGFEIARRTVTKYREQLHIPAAQMRAFLA